mgnify:CR=1 FL=1
MDGRDIGQHPFDITRESGVVSVRSDARFDIPLLFLKAYTYSHQSLEHYDNNGCLVKFRNEK